MRRANAACEHNMRTHRLGVRDCAAFERDDPIEHSNHSAALHPAETQIPAATVRIPSRAPAPRASARLIDARPSRTEFLASVSDIATVWNSAVPL